MKFLIYSIAITFFTSTPLFAAESRAQDKTKGHWTVRIFSENIEDFGLQNTKTLALTFDDGPGDGTAAITKLLANYGIEAAFFSIGENAKQLPELLKAERAARPGGLQNIIGNHSYTHPELDQGKYTTSPTALYKQLIMTDRHLKNILGEEDFFSQSHGVLFFRAPYGAWKPIDAKLLRERERDYGARAEDLRRYLGPIYWNAGGEIACGDTKVDGHPENCDGKALTDAADWDCWDHKLSVERCAEGYWNKIESTKGGVVLSHDIYANTAAMWALLLPKLKAAGYKFIRLDKIPNLEKYKIPKALKEN